MKKMKERINQKDLDTDVDISELIDESPIAEFMELHPRDVRALFRLVNDDLPLVMKAHRASDLLKLVENQLVNGWSDPRMPTISGLRRRGYTAKALKEFILSLTIDDILKVWEGLGYYKSAHNIHESAQIIVKFFIRLN